MTKKTFYFHVCFSAFLVAGVVHFILRSKDVAHQAALVALCCLFLIIVVRALREARAGVE